jgi:hypothetical protein
MRRPWAKRCIWAPSGHLGTLTEMNDATSWSKSSEFLRSTDVEAARRTADVLDSSAPRWSRALISRTSMHDLLFTLPGDEYPFSSSVRVSWEQDRYEFRLARQSRLVTADRSFEVKAPDVLDAFLEQLVSES